jgi:hypothetical protein
MGGNTISRWSKPAFAAAACALALLLLGKIFLAGYHSILVNGFCCADDAYFAIIAKTLALQGKYGLPMTSDIISPFDPSIGVGPALIIPEALMILIGGVDFRLPGLTVILLHTIQVIVLFSIIARRTGCGRSALYVITVLVLQLYFSANRFYFGVGIGEVPMLGFLAVGIMALGLLGESRRGVALGGLSLSLAVLTKQAAIYPAAAICAAWTIDRFIQERHAAWRMIAPLAGSFAAPILLFEFIRWRALGSAGYVANWKGIAIMAQSLKSDSASPGMLIDILHQHYRIGIAVLLLAGLSLVLTTMSKQQSAPSIRRTSLLIATAIAVSIIAFVMSRWTNERYAWIIPMLLALLLPLPILTSKLLPAAAIFVAIFWQIGPELDILDRLLSPTRLADSQNVQEERESIVTFIANKHPTLPIYGQSWHSFYDVAYFLPSYRKWYLSNDENEVGKRDAMYVIFTRFAGINYPIYGKIHSQCARQLDDLKQFEVYMCSKVS